MTNSGKSGPCSPEKTDRTDGGRTGRKQTILVLRAGRTIVAIRFQGNRKDGIFHMDMNQTPTQMTLEEAMARAKDMLTRNEAEHRQLAEQTEKNEKAHTALLNQISNLQRQIDDRDMESLRSLMATKGLSVQDLIRQLGD